jgi:hypothetical protein
MTKSEKRVLAMLNDGDWHPESEIRSSRALLERLWLASMIEGGMYGVGSYPEHRLWRKWNNPQNQTPDAT